MPLGSHVPLAVEEPCLAVDALPGEVSKEIHDAIAQGFGSAYPTGGFPFTLWTLRIHSRFPTSQNSVYATSKNSELVNELLNLEPIVDGNSGSGVACC